MARAMTSRDSRIGKALLANLKTQLTLRDVAGVILVSLERLLWLDSDSFLWSVENLIPVDILQEIQGIISTAIYKRLIEQGLIPGQDFSVDADRKLLLNCKAKVAILA